MKVLKKCAAMLCATALMLTASVGSIPAFAAQEEKSVQTAYQVQGEMRAVWVPYLSLDLSKSADKSEAAFRRMYDNILKKAKDSGMNTMIVHVRPFGDSMYPSNYFPWSHLLTGMQGKNPGYDPLAYMVQATHNAGMEFHAWVNPLRVRIGNNPPEMSSNNAHNFWKNNYSDRNDWTFSYGDGIYYNPAYESVRNYIADGIWEIVKNYNVDGIQFDDYFYPFNVNSNDVKVDSAAYQQSGSTQSIGQWRTDNINKLVALVNKQIKMAKPGMTFGISPQGNVQNCLNAGADVYKWTSTPGYIDYICPQIYFQLDHPTLPFETAAKKWKSMVTAPNVKYYIGLGLYKAGQADGWTKSNNILAQEIQIGRKLNADGWMLYSWAYLDTPQTKAEMGNIKKLL